MKIATLALILLSMSGCATNTITESKDIQSLSEFDYLKANAYKAATLAQDADKKVRNNWSSLKWSKGENGKDSIGVYRDNLTGRVMMVSKGINSDYFGEGSDVENYSFGCRYTYGADRNRGFIDKRCGQSKAGISEGWKTFEQAHKLVFLELHNGKMNGPGLACTCPIIGCAEIVDCKEQWYLDDKLTDVHKRNYPLPPLSSFDASIVSIGGVQGCGPQSTKSGQIYRVNGSEVNLLSAPGKRGKKLINERATEILGSTQYLQIDKSITVKEECYESGWSKVGVTDPDWLINSHKGWVQSSSLRGQKVNMKGEVEFTDADFVWDNRNSPYKKIIIAGVNKLHNENVQCKIIDPSSATISSKGTEDNPIFYVTCGSGANVFNSFFSKSDVEKGLSMSAAPHVNQTTAIQQCEAYAKSNATHPSTVSFSKFMDLAVREFPNGRTSIDSSFTAKNDFNLEIKYNIRCLSDTKGFFEATVSENH